MLDNIASERYYIQKIWGMNSLATKSSMMLSVVDLKHSSRNEESPDSGKFKVSL